MAEPIARREKARRDLIAFTELTHDRYVTAEHHRTVARELERVEKGEVDRLMLLLPPRHGKSELASRRFPAWYLGRRPHGQFISASANSEFASDFGRDVRNIIASEEYRDIFKTRLAEDSQAKNKWNTRERGSYYAVGIGGQLMGRGADVLLIDDPFATMEDALSETARKRVWEWYQGTAYNRLQPKGSIIVINHRMHEEDLSGRLLDQQAAGGDRWRVVELPAIDKKGLALWPSAYSLGDLERIRTNTLPRFWSALYQQNPIPDEGTYFKSEWIKTYQKAPSTDHMRIYGASDFAVTSGGGDFTVHLVIGVDPTGDMYVLDMWRKQSASDEWIEVFCDMVKEWKPLEWALESGQIKGALGPLMDKRQRERQAYVYRSTFPTRADKSIRAQSIRGRMGLIGLYIPFNEDWASDLKRELLSFPAGRHDDIVDSLGLIGQLLAHVESGEVEAIDKKPEFLHEATLDDLWEENEA